MCQNALHDFLVALPKCEHHIHIEGSLEPELLFKLAKQNNITLPSDEDPAFRSVVSLRERYSRLTDLDDFLHYYLIGMSVLIKASDFEELAYTYFKKARSQNVHHAEIFFDPQAHIDRGIKYEDIVSGLTSARQRAFEEFNITTELIVCLLRHLSLDSCHQTLLTALPDLKSTKIRGLGLSSTEHNNPPQNYKQIFSLAHTHGIKNLTAHAGAEQTSNVSTMLLTAQDLRCTRIDHGLKLIDSPSALGHFASRKIGITICPVSELELGYTPSIQDLPIPEYLEAGILFSINSDDPAYFFVPQDTNDGDGDKEEGKKEAYIQRVYCAVQQAFNLSRDQWRRIARNSVEMSWCDDQRKNEIWRDIDRLF